MIIWIIILSLFNHFFLAKTPERQFLCLRLPVLMLSHPLLLDAFPITKLGPVGEVRRPASTPHPRPTPPILEFPARALTTPHPNPPSSLLSPIFRISSKADVAKSASSRYNKIHILFKASYIVENTQQTVSSDKVSWQIWLLAYIPRGLALASRSWGRLIQNPPETLFMAQFCARKWVLNIFDICCLLWHSSSNSKEVVWRMRIINLSSW